MAQSFNAGMEHFKHLDAKTVELSGIAASMAGGCRPCLDYHFNKALEVGCTIDQIKVVTELGKMIKQRPIKDMYDHVEKLITNFKK